MSSRPGGRIPGWPNFDRRDGDGPVDVFLNVRFLADNPYPALWAEAVARAGGRVEDFSLAQVLRRRWVGRGWVNIQWPEWVLTGAHPWRDSARLIAGCAAARVVGHRVMLTVHNVRGHDTRQRRLERALWWTLGSLATDVHCLTEASVHEFHSAVRTSRGARVVVIPHGDYRRVIGSVPEKDEARRQWLIPSNAVTYCLFGKLKTYKGLDSLVRAFAETTPGDRLLLCGAPADKNAEEYVGQLQANDRVVVVPRFLGQDELTAAIVASDVVVLPYARVTNSGSALMALSVGRPVVLPRTTAFEELRAKVGEDWVHLFDGDLTASVLETAAATDRTDGPDLTWCSWESIEKYLRFLFTDGDDRRRLMPSDSTLTMSGAGHDLDGRIDGTRGKA